MRNFSEQLIKDHFQVILSDSLTCSTTDVHVTRQKRIFLKKSYHAGNSRSSHWRCSMKKSILKNFKKFIDKHLCQSFFFNKIAGLRSATLLKKKIRHRCFPVNFVKSLRTSSSRTPPVTASVIGYC